MPVARRRGRYQKRGVKVKLYDMKPEKKSPAHKYDGLCELVQQFLRADGTANAVGLFKRGNASFGFSDYGMCG